MTDLVVFMILVVLGVIGWFRYFQLRYRATYWAERIEKANPSVANYIREILK